MRISETQQPLKLKTEYIFRYIEKKKNVLRFKYFS